MANNDIEKRALFACSGASDVGELSDRVTRALARKGKGKMLWLAGVSSGDCIILQNVKNAGHLVLIDGCDKHCAKKTMEINGFSGFTHIELTKFGYVCGETKVTDKVVEQAVEKVSKLI